MAAIVYLNKILYQVAGNPAMSGAVKGKGVIMKKITCVEFDEKMTELMQQIEDLNAIKAGLFCNREKMKSEDFVKQLMLNDNDIHHAMNYKYKRSRQLNQKDFDGSIVDE